MQESLVRIAAVVPLISAIAFAVDLKVILAALSTFLGTNLPIRKSRPR